MGDWPSWQHGYGTLCEIVSVQCTRTGIQQGINLYDFEGWFILLCIIKFRIYGNAERRYLNKVLFFYTNIS